MKSYKARGVVLHTVKYGDSSLVVYLLTDLLGRQNYLVQGVRSVRGKGNKGAFFQPMFLVEFEGLEPPRGQMHRMKEVRMPVPLSSLPFDVRKSTISLFMAEVLYRLIREVEPNSSLFDFVAGAVVALDSLEEGVSNFHLWFLVRLSVFLGFYPGNEYLPGGWFDIREGLFCPVMPQHRLMLSPEHAEILHRMMTCDVKELGDVRLARGQRSDFLNAMLTYFGYHLDSIHRVQSIPILRDVF